MKYAELETLLGDVERARGIFELAIKQTKLDMPEILWKVLTYSTRVCFGPLFYFLISLGLH